MTVRELGERMTVDELLEWVAFDQIEPFGDDYLQTGVLAASIYNASGNLKRAIKPEQIIPQLKERKAKPVEGHKFQDTINRFRALVAFQKGDPSALDAYAD